MSNIEEYKTEKDGLDIFRDVPNELFDASSVVKEFTNIFVGNKVYTNLPRKFNVAITACKEACTHAGRMTSEQLLGAARLSETYGNGEIRLLSVRM